MIIYKESHPEVEASKRPIDDVKFCFFCIHKTRARI